MFASMTIKAFYRNFLTQLQNIYSLNEATAITDWVFEKVAVIKKADIITDPHQPVNPLTAQLLNNKLYELLLHKPVQYVLGEAWFYKMNLKVTRDVLIPRPETEELVQTAIDTMQVKPAPYRVLDIGTGSGCIAIALKKALPGIHVTAIDISGSALEVAKENAAAQNETIFFLQLDFLDELQWENLPIFDIIVSNPPYIPFDQKEKLDKNVAAYEPHTALFVPDHSPLLFYEKIAAFGKKHLTTGGKILMETHEDLAKETASLFEGSYKAVVIKKDIFGKERMVIVSG